MSRGITLCGMTVEQAYHSPPPVADLPGDLDWPKWSKDAIYFQLKHGPRVEIYAVNPNDCSCYSLATFTFCDSMICYFGLPSNFAYCTVIDSKIYLLGRNDPNNYVLTELWIWDILEARKKKLAGESYDWKLGPRPNSAKDRVLVFSLSGDLYALDICRNFYPVVPNSEGLKAASKSREENPDDFERLPISSSRQSSLSWQTLCPLRVEKFARYDRLEFLGYCCLQDRFFLHMSDEDLFSHIFCFNVTTGLWTHRRFSDIPLAVNIPLDEMEDEIDYEAEYVIEQRLTCMQYSAQVRNHAFFISPYTGKLSACDISTVTDLLEKGSESYPCFSVDVDVDDTHILKDILDRMPYSVFEMCQTFHLGDKRNCWIAFYYDSGYRLNAWICTFDLEKKKSVEKTTLSAANDVARIWMVAHGASVLPIS